MTEVQYFRDYYHQRIKQRVAVLVCLKRINDKRISEREEREKEQEAKRRKLNASSSSGGSISDSTSRGSSCGSNMVSAEMMKGLPPAVLAMIEENNRKIEEKDRKIEEKDQKNEALARKLEEKSEEINQLRKDFRLLKGVVAESKITAFEMWREILEFL